MLKKWLVFCVGISALGFSAPSVASPDRDKDLLTAIPSLDVPRYIGRWYEIAKYPNRFQKKCVGDTTAEYSRQPSGDLQVINRCRMENGLYDEAIGAARQIGEQSSAKLKVRFAPAWLSFIPAVWGDYWVIELDTDYQLVAVSEPKREYLWILSRSPMLSPDRYERLLQRLRDKGFDTHKLEMTLHAAKP
jgi:apolipoprotein D and lipocalin family protein